MFLNVSCLFDKCCNVRLQLGWQSLHVFVTKILFYNYKKTNINITKNKIIVLGFIIIIILLIKILKNYDDCVFNDPCFLISRSVSKAVWFPLVKFKKEQKKIT